MHIVNPPKGNPLAYPICTFSYVLLPLKTDKAPELRKFVFYALTQGQKLGPRLLFVPIPKVGARRGREDAEAGSELARIPALGASGRLSRRDARSLRSSRQATSGVAGPDESADGSAITSTMRYPPSREAIEKSTYSPSIVAGTSTPPTAASAGKTS